MVAHITLLPFGTCLWFSKMRKCWPTCPRWHLILLIWWGAEITYCSFFVNNESRIFFCPQNSELCMIIWFVASYYYFLYIYILHCFIFCDLFSVVAHLWKLTEISLGSPTQRLLLSRLLSYLLYSLIGPGLKINMFHACSLWQLIHSLFYSRHRQHIFNSYDSAFQPYVKKDGCFMGSIENQEFPPL